VEVILLEKIVKLGALGAKVKVKPGYARNYLLPQGKALSATKENLERFEKERTVLEKTAQERFDKAKQRASTLEGIRITIPANAADEGRLFGSVGAYENV